MESSIAVGSEAVCSETVRSRAVSIHRRFSAVLRGVFVLILLLRQQADADQVQFSSSMNPVGSGARASGMGGAFIAVADDATAASWNPAGLIHLERPEASLVYSSSFRSHDYHAVDHPELEGRLQRIAASDINFASIAYPLTMFGRNTVVALTYQRLYDMNRKADIRFRYDFSPDFIEDRISFRQNGYLGAFSPAVAVQLTPELYLGATVNIWSNIFGTCSWRFTEAVSGTGVMFGDDYREKIIWSEKNTFSGQNVNIGLLYGLTGSMTAGLVVKTPFTASVRRTTTLSIDSTLSPSSGPVTGSETVKIRMPLSYGVGLAYRHSDRLTVALDLYRTRWSEYAATDGAGNRTNPVSSNDLSEGKPKDTNQLRAGVEYLVIGDRVTVPLRAGVFYDPEPGVRKVDDFFGASLGSGVAYGNTAFDVSYQYRRGSRVSSDIPLAGITGDISQHSVMSSLIYHF